MISVEQSDLQIEDSVCAVWVTRTTVLFCGNRHTTRSICFESVAKALQYTGKWYSDIVKLLITEFQSRSTWTYLRLREVLNSIYKVFQSTYPMYLLYISLSRRPSYIHNIYTRTYVRSNIHIHTYVNINMYIHRHTQVYTHTHTYMSIHIYIYRTYTHTHTHTHTYMQASGFGQE